MSAVTPIRPGISTPAAARQEEADDLGLTPEVQERLTHAACAIREALQAVNSAKVIARPHSDADYRCRETLDRLVGARWRTMEWMPNAEDCGD